MTLRCLSGHAAAHSENLGVVKGLLKGDVGCMGPKLKDLGMWRKMGKDQRNFGLGVEPGCEGCQSAPY